LLLPAADGSVRSEHGGFTPQIAALVRINDHTCIQNIRYLSSVQNIKKPINRVAFPIGSRSKSGSKNHYDVLGKLGFLLLGPVLQVLLHVLASLALKPTVSYGGLQFHR
jgi:hypothetical protein